MSRPSQTRTARVITCTRETLGTVLLGCLSIAFFVSPAAAQHQPPFDEGAMTLASLVEPNSVGLGRASEAKVKARDDDGALSGRVSVGRSPLDSVRVYAYQLADLKLKKVLTDRLGEFSFDRLPAGLYKVIAHKPGFVPAVVMVTRSTAATYQYLDLELAQDDGLDETGEADFWKVRSRIPSDVLHDIQLAESSLLTEPQIPEQPFSAEMRALSGVQDFSSDVGGQLTGGLVDVNANLGSIALALEGDFRTVQRQNVTQGTLASTQHLALSIDNEGQSHIRLSSMRNHLDADATAMPRPIDMESYGVDWQQRIGRGESSFRAHYLSESNFLRGGDRVRPLGLASSSESWMVEGAYETQTSRRSSLRTGLSYRQIQPRNSFDPLTATPSERIDLFGLGEAELQPALMVQYGLFTSLHDGTVSFSPHAGVVVQLNDKWSTDAAVRHRFQNESSLYLPYTTTPAYYNERSNCGLAEANCYKMGFTRSFHNENEEIHVGTIYREYSETLRLYFSDDFFDNLESLFLVPGDELPEVQFAFSKQLGPYFLTRFESNIASGGGGLFTAADGAVFENQVGYLVTSIDTQFKPTSTGLLLAFHRMEQELAPLDARHNAVANMDLDRFQIQVTQRLSSLLGIGSDWALSLDMQLSRGATPYALTSSTDDDDVRRRVVGGIAVRF